MPTYDYQCESCQHRAEVFQKITDAPLKTCPQCQKETFQRGIGGGSATFRFVGEGFYINDYKEKCSSSCKCDGE